MATPTVISDDVLSPVSAAMPAGVDLSLTVEWVRFTNARPNTWDTGTKDQWERLEPRSSNWATLKTLTTEALATKSKDLRLALWLLESSANVDGFAGVRDGIRLIHNLLLRYWDAGLYPQIETNDIEARTGLLAWMNEKLADALREIPLTRRPAPGVNYSANYYRESRRANGLIAAPEFESAAVAGSLEEYLELREDIETAAAALTEFDQFGREKFGPDGISVVEAKDAFEECRRIVNGMIRQKPGAEMPPQSVQASEEPLPDLVFANPDGAASWAAAEQLARTGDIDRALSQMTALANVEPNGRSRFQRKLLLSDICLKTGRRRVAKTVLEELAEQIDKHDLEHWETSELVAAVWTRLYKCCTENAAGSADQERAAKLFERLCRLNPWQALGCSERAGERAQ